MRLSSGRVRRALLVAWVAGGWCASAAHAHPPGDTPAAAGVLGLAQAAVASGDHGARPFVVVDKRAAHLHVFDAAGRPLADTPVLLGAALGDHSVPGIGERPPEAIAPHERTTPAGRFVAEPGRNLDGEHVLWFDYGAGLAIHRLRPTAAYAARSERLVHGNARARRVSLGCVVVPGPFYDEVVRPLLAARRGTVVYVLPETVPAQQVFAGLGVD
jgi:hypothetical protein